MLKPKSQITAEILNFIHWTGSYYHLLQPKEQFWHRASKAFFERIALFLLSANSRVSGHPPAHGCHQVEKGLQSCGKGAVPAPQSPDGQITHPKCTLFIHLPQLASPLSAGWPHAGEAWHRAELQSSSSLPPGASTGSSALPSSSPAGLRAPSLPVAAGWGESDPWSHHGGQCLQCASAAPPVRAGCEAKGSRGRACTAGTPSTSSALCGTRGGKAFQHWALSQPALHYWG